MQPPESGERSSTRIMVGSRGGFVWVMDAKLTQLLLQGGIRKAMLR